MRDILYRLMADRAGTTLIEYGLIAGIVGISAVLGLTASGQTLFAIFDQVGTHMAEAASN